MRRFSTSRIFKSQLARQVLAILGCVVLLYVVSGLAFLHHHTQDPRRLATFAKCYMLRLSPISPGDLIPAAHQVARHSSTLELFNAENFVASHRTPRAPPVA